MFSDISKQKCFLFFRLFIAIQVHSFILATHPQVCGNAPCRCGYSVAHPGPCTSASAIGGCKPTSLNNRALNHDLAKCGRWRLWVHVCVWYQRHCTIPCPCGWKRSVQSYPRRPISSSPCWCMRERTTYSSSMQPPSTQARLSSLQIVYTIVVEKAIVVDFSQNNTTFSIFKNIQVNDESWIMMRVYVQTRMYIQKSLNQQPYCNHENKSE